MNKKKLVKVVSKKTMVTEGDIGIIIDVFLDGVRKSLEKGERVTILNFGSFHVLTRKAREAINPRNRNHIHVPEKKVVKFEPSKKLFDLVNK